MKIAIASGKGGTGKTTIATNLAVTIANNNKSVTYADCDVEEPNGHIFLKPDIKESYPVGIPVPQVDESKCNGCGQCAKICEYSAIICLAGKTLTFPELCHGCGGCKLVCPTNAITEVTREIGVIEKGTTKKVRFIHGKLNIGQATSPPLIRAVREATEKDNPEIAIFDAPPGTSCPVIESIRDVDFTVLVTEPTPFGLNDLKLAVGMLREIRQKFFVVINRHDMGNSEVEEYCKKESLPVFLTLPDDRKIAEAYSKGKMIVDALPQYQKAFANLYEEIEKQLA